MFRVSLRELLILVAAIALVIVSFQSGSLFWQGLVGLTAMLAMGMAVIAGVLEKGPGRAFAIGAAVMMCGYALLVTVYRSAEATSVEGILPTTVLLRSIYPVFDNSGWVYAATSDPIPVNANPSINPDGSNSLNGQPVHFQQQPVFHSFISIGHSWFLLLFGYLGGRFARFIYLRRSKESTPPAE
jgi:hypothetical protein